MDDEPGQGRLARGPVRCPEAATERERDALLCEFLVHAGCGEGLQGASSALRIGAYGIKEETYDGDDVTERAAGSLLASDSSNFEKWVEQDESHLSATNTVSAFCACAPNTLRKNRLATVTPELCISSFVAALSDPMHSKCGQPE